MKLLRFISILVLCLALSQQAQAALMDLFKGSKLKKEYGQRNRNSPRSFDTETIGSFKAIKKPVLNFSLAGNINLYLQKENKIHYPLISDAQNYDFFDINSFDENPFVNALSDQAKDIIKKRSVLDPPEGNAILYKESQLLLQEFISSQILAFKENKLDLVFFTGNHIYSNNQVDHFYTNLVESFGKYQIPHYEVLGSNEARGQKDIKKEMGDFYYLLQTKKTNFIVLNNLFKEVIPEHLPYEADEQYIWLETILAKLEKENFGEDLIIISYKEPSKRLINYIQNHNHLNLIAFIYGEAYEYKEQEWQGIVFISTPSLSKYPCSYLKVNRNIDGFYSFNETMLDLEGVQEMAKSKL